MKALLHIEMLPGAQMNFKLEGDPATVAAMISNVMQHSREIAAAMMAPVIDYCLKEGIDCGELKDMIVIQNFKP